MARARGRYRRTADARVAAARRADRRRGRHGPGLVRCPTGQPGRRTRADPRRRRLPSPPPPLCWTRLDDPDPTTVPPAVRRTRPQGDRHRLRRRHEHRRASATRTRTPTTSARSSSATSTRRWKGKDFTEDVHRHPGAVGARRRADRRRTARYADWSRSASRPRRSTDEVLAGAPPDHRRRARDRRCSGALGAGLGQPPAAPPDPRSRRAGDHPDVRVLRRGAAGRTRRAAAARPAGRLDADERRGLATARPRRLVRRLDDRPPRPRAGARRRARRLAGRCRTRCTSSATACWSSNQAPAHWDGRDVGSVVTLRDRTELQSVTAELDTVRGLAEALRAQNHESSNRHAHDGVADRDRPDPGGDRLRDP